MLSKVIIFVTLFACWYIFSGENSPFFIIAGLFSAAFGVFIAIRMQLVSELGISPKRAFRYVIWLASQVILSSLDVIKRVWNLKPISPTMGEISTSQTTAIGHTIYGNSITMTPGTVTVDVDEETGKMIVHAISAEGFADLQKGEMDKQVKAILKVRK